jgi:phytoene synthase
MISLIFRRSDRQGGSTDWNAILARHGRSFWLASRFLPRETRHDVTTIYAFFRYLDDIADTGRWDPRQAEALLCSWQAWLVSDFATPVPNPSLARAVARVYARYGLPTQYARDLIDGLLDDLFPRRIRSLPELYHYCYQVAGAVGLTLAPLLGVHCRPGQSAANALGIAMQLTNIARDVGEDLRRGRLYLPIEDLARFGIQPHELERLASEFRPPDHRLQAVIRLQIMRARQFYRQAVRGYPCLPPRVRLAIIVSAEVYGAILQVIERNHYDTIRLRAVAGYDDKAVALLRAWQMHRRLSHGVNCSCPSFGIA